MNRLSSRSSRFASWAVATTNLAALAGVIILLNGCGPPKTGIEGFGDSQAISREQDHFSVGMNFFRRFDEFDPQQARKQVLDNLNRWAESQPADPNWKPEPLIARIPSPWNEIEPLKKLGKTEFEIFDIEPLQEAAAFRDISRWVSEQKLEPFLAKRLPGEDEGLSKDDIQRLAAALRLFDWTIRNIQLDELLPMPKAAIAGPSADPKKPNAAPPPPHFQGVPGPGYRHAPGQTLLQGHGDAWERARIFVLLCRQEGIDAVMLGIIEGAPSSPPKPWLPAVNVKDRLYLLDTALGLPVAGPEGKGIATLAQAAADPKVLRQLDLDDEHRYPVSAEALTQVVALIDAAPTTLSRRMQLAEARLSGDDQMVLSVSPSALKEKLSAVRGVSGVQIWTIPYESLVFRAMYMQIVMQNPATRVAFFREEGPFQTKNPLVLGRHQHFRGIFDQEDERRLGDAGDDSNENSGREAMSARALYLAARIPDDDISKIEKSIPKGEKESAEAWNERKEATIAGMKMVRHSAAFWLGQTHYERGNYATASDWFQRRTLDVSTEGPWVQGARYNLARAREIQGDIAGARELYLTDESPQRHGNELRSRWLD